MLQILALAAGAAMGAGVAQWFLSTNKPAEAASNDRYGDYIMATGAVAVNPRVPTDGVWLLDYKAGKLLGTVIDRNSGKIIGWAEVDLTAEFGLARQADVHFLMTTGYITQGQSALYLAETTTGQFGVYTMGPGPNGTGIVIRRHDLTRFRDGGAAGGGVPPGWPPMGPGGGAPVGAPSGNGNTPGYFPPTTTGVSPVVPPNVGGPSTNSGKAGSGTVPTLPGGPQSPGLPAPVGLPSGGTETRPMFPSPGMSYRGNHGATQITAVSAPPSMGGNNAAWPVLENTPSQGREVTSSASSARLPSITPLAPLRNDVGANTVFNYRNEAGGTNLNGHAASSGAISGTAAEGMPLSGRGGPSALGNLRTAAPSPQLVQNQSPFQLDPTLLLQHFLRPLPPP